MPTPETNKPEGGFGRVNYYVAMSPPAGGCIDDAAHYAVSCYNAAESLRRECRIHARAWAVTLMRDALERAMVARDLAHAYETSGFAFSLIALRHVR